MVFISPYLTDAEMRNSLNSYAKLLNDQEQSLRSHEEVVRGREEMVSQKAEQLEKREKAISAKESELKRREAGLAAKENGRQSEPVRAESAVPRASAPPAPRHPQPQKQNLPSAQPSSSRLAIPLKRTQNFREMATPVVHSLDVNFDGIEVMVGDGGNKKRVNTGGGGARPVARKSAGVSKPSATAPKQTKKDSKKQSAKNNNGTGENKRNIGPFNRYLSQNKDRLKEKARRRGVLGPGSVTQLGAEEWRQIKDKSPWMATASANLGEGKGE